MNRHFAVTNSNQRWSSEDLVIPLIHLRESLGLGGVQEPKKPHVTLREKERLRQSREESGLSLEPPPMQSDLHSPRSWVSWQSRNPRRSLS
jgi:hypothetical protein